MAAETLWVCATCGILPQPEATAMDVVEASDLHNAMAHGIPLRGSLSGATRGLR